MQDLLNALPGAVAQGLVWGLLAVGVFITFRVLGIADLTVDGSVVTGAAVCTTLIVAGVSVPLAITCAFIAGCAAGSITGALHVYLGIPDILAGILTQMALWSVNLKIIGKANQPLSSRTYPLLVSQLNKPHAILILLLFTTLMIAVLYAFFGTELGCALRAVGSNAAMSRAQGINVGVMKVLGLSLSNGIVALSGALLCQYQGFTDINMGRGAVVIGLAAVVIGEALVSRIGHNFALKLGGVTAGAVVYYLVYQIIIFIGMDTDLLKMLSALVVAVFLGAPYLQKKYKTLPGVTHLRKAGGEESDGNA